MVLFEYIGGGTLAKQAKLGLVGTEEAWRVFGQLADALQYIHRHHVCHRDIKGENILLDEPGKRAVLADFGLATRLAKDEICQDV